MPSILIDAIQRAAARFDTGRYPKEVYYDVIQRVGSANNQKELADALAHAIAWKDGKTQIDPRGPYQTVLCNTRYQVKATKPNTFGEHHYEILSSDEFYSWACQIRVLQHFDANLVYHFNERFGLWNSVVIPVFVLHCLRPQIFPIFDRWVLNVYRVLGADHATGLKPSVETYAAYHAWWLLVLAEAGFGPMCAQINTLKEIDGGLWVLGKQMAELSGPSASDETGDDAEDTGEEVAINVFGTGFSTGSREFKERAVAIRNEGKTQLEAIKQAARELGIELDPTSSYIRYPGSHFDRWRKQGVV